MKSVLLSSNVVFALLVIAQGVRACMFSVCRGVCRGVGAWMGVCVCICRLGGGGAQFHVFSSSSDTINIHKKN